ncbi:hypothetical protein ACMHYO_16315 [Allopusillimonas ginsengisoli]|uniref:hypothetical protein n=1 Tax=Allopusillimonas ginsengisoli TaxID=453575 RepID=UPI0039C21132
MSAVMIPMAVTVLSFLLAHASSDEAEGRDSMGYILRAISYGNAAIVSTWAWVLWWVI